jgi:formate dehydrogenase gamma subunit
MIRGQMGTETRPGGRLIERFTPSDRMAHWLLAIVWVTLAITGLILSLGKGVLLPLIGYTLFSWLAALSKNLHNFVGPILIIAVPWMFIQYVRDNGIGKEDFKWFLHIFDYFKGHEYPSHRFNAGEKLVFWGVVVVLSTVLIVSGLTLVFPNFGQDRSTMQWANAIHMVAAFMAIALACVHMYLGTIGLAGSYRAMRYGYVDASWAEHHHLRWYEDVSPDGHAKSLWARRRQRQSRSPDTILRDRSKFTRSEPNMKTSRCVVCRCIGDRDIRDRRRKVAATPAADRRAKSGGRREKSKGCGRGRAHEGAAGEGRGPRCRALYRRTKSQGHRRHAHADRCLRRRRRSPPLRVIRRRIRPPANRPRRKHPPSRSRHRHQRPPGPDASKDSNKK